MAKNWTEAQRNEKEFWKRIYIDKAKDIKSYTAISPQAAIDFVHKTMKRHEMSVDDLSGKVVADIGCGPYGLILGLDHQFDNHLQEKPMLLGVDPLMDFYVSEIGLLKEKDNVRLYNAKAESLPINESSCDYVFSVNVLDHVENPERCAAELYRITKEGGLCGISLHVVTPLFSPFAAALKYIDSNHPHHFTLNKFRETLARVFDRVDVSKIVTVIEDQPEFAFRKILSSSNKLLAIARWGYTLIMRTVYLNCWKKPSSS